MSSNVVGLVVLLLVVVALEGALHAAARAAARRGRAYGFATDGSDVVDVAHAPAAHAMADVDAA